MMQRKLIESKYLIKVEFPYIELGFGKEYNDKSTFCEVCATFEDFFKLISLSRKLYPFNRVTPELVFYLEQKGKWDSVRFPSSYKLASLGKDNISVDLDKQMIIEIKKCVNDLCLQTGHAAGMPCNIEAALFHYRPFEFCLLNSQNYVQVIEDVALDQQVSTYELLDSNLENVFITKEQYDEIYNILFKGSFKVRRNLRLEVLECEWGADPRSLHPDSPIICSLINKRTVLNDPINKDFYNIFKRESLLEDVYIDSLRSRVLFILTPATAKWPYYSVKIRYDLLTHKNHHIFGLESADDVASFIYHSVAPKYTAFKKQEGVKGGGSISDVIEYYKRTHKNIYPGYEEEFKILKEEPFCCSLKKHKLLAENRIYYSALSMFNSKFVPAMYWLFVPSYVLANKQDKLLFSVSKYLDYELQLYDSMGKEAMWWRGFLQQLEQNYAVDSCNYDQLEIYRIASDRYWFRNYLHYWE